MNDTDGSIGVRVQNSGLISRIVAPISEFGIIPGLLYLGSRVLNSLSPNLNLYVYDLVAQPVPGTAPRAANAAIVRLIPPEDAALSLMPVPREVIEERFRQGAICIGYFRNETLQAYMWILVGVYEEDEVRCTYVSSPVGRSAFDFDVYVFPAYRMGRTFLNLWNGANAVLTQRGVAWTFSRITRFNTASRNAHARLGAVRVGRALFLRAWTVQAMVSTSRPYAGLTIRRDRRIVLQLEPPSS